MTAPRPETRTALLAFGANQDGSWGPPHRSILTALQKLDRLGLKTRRLSPFYLTVPIGRIEQAPFINAVALVTTGHPAAKVFSICKRLERLAGRSGVLAGGARPLDIDVIDYGGRVLGWPPRRVKGRLILPHPEAHKRRFVLQPLADVAPRWRHPVSGVAGTQLLRICRTPADDVQIIEDCRGRS